MQLFTHNIIMGPPSKCSFVWIMKLEINFRIKCCNLGCLQNYPCNFCITFVQKDETAMLDLEIDSNLNYSHKGTLWGGSHYKIMCEKLHIWTNYRRMFPWNFCMPFVQKDKTVMLDLEIDSNLHYSHKGSFWGGSHSRVMCKKLHIWTNYRGVFPWNFCKCANFAIWRLFLPP